MTTHHRGEPHPIDSPDRAEPRATRWMPSWLCRHWPLAVVAVVASFLLLANLGADHLWEDEGDTAVLAANILKHHVPIAWDGVTFVAPEYGQRLTKSFVMISHPWLQYYAAAASFAVFGESAWAARFPFALAGLGTILVVYGMTAALLRSRLAALSAALLLTLNVQFLLFARQARNYSFHALLTCLLIWQFHRLDSRVNAVLFAVLGILLFHTHPLGLAVVMALGSVTLIGGAGPPSRGLFWVAAAAIGLYAVPWLVLSRAGYAPDLAPLHSLRVFLPRLLQFAIECASVTPLIGVAVLFLYLKWKRHRTVWRPASFQGSLLTVCLTATAMESLVMAATQSREVMWIEGLHQTPSIIPLTMILAGWLIATVSSSSPRVWMTLMLVFGVTRLPEVTPWAIGAKAGANWDSKALIAFHVPNTLAGQFFRTTQFHFVKSLSAANPGVIARISEFLKQNAGPRDVVVTNYAWEPLYFHTHLPQGIKVASSFQIYAAVRAADLPEYVFSPSGTRWIVWRRAWPASFAQQDLPQVLQRFRDAGLSPRLAASIPETLYENRENVHFHRFAGGMYVFPQSRNLPDALIYCIETLDESIADHRGQLTTKPDDVETLGDLGVALVHAGRLREAMIPFHHAVDMAPDNALAQRNLANALFDRQQIADAAVHASLAATLAPGDPAAHDVLGRALAVQGYGREAIGQFERALEIDPANPEVRKHLERVRQFERRSSPSPTASLREPLNDVGRPKW